MSDKIFPANRSESGPFDSSEIDLPAGFLDFGSIRVAPTSEFTMKLEVEEATRRVVAITFEKDHSTLQVSVFAASKHEGVWSDVMELLTESITSAGGSATQVSSQFGFNLEAKVVIPGEGHRDIRFLGVDGPRWFIRGSITGVALADPALTAEFEELFRSLVIHRGDSPMPPREPLDLVVPAGIITPPRPGF
jgi:hypothetical protein